jgi:glycosyltransferase involved in cell wall biosynthesis
VINLYGMLKTIIVVNDTDYINGGASKIALCSAFAMAKKNYDVIYFSGTDEAERSGWDNKIKFITVGQKEIVKEKRKTRAFIQGLWNVNAKNKFDELLNSLDKNNTVIHVHSWTKVLSSSIIRVARKKGFKIVFTLHDYFTACPNGGLYNYKAKCICNYRQMSVKCILSNCDSRNYYYKVWRLIRQYIQIFASGIPADIYYYISISEFSERIFKKYLPEKARIFRINNPIDVIQQAPVDVSSNNTCVYIGRMSLEKGVLEFAQAASELNIAPLFIGSGACVDDIKKKCPKANIAGWLCSDEAIQLLRRARFIVFPSLWYETQGLVVLEATSLGIPVIVAKDCAASEYVRDGDNGYLFKTGDVEDLKIKMLKLLSSDDEVRKMGANAYHGYWVKPDSVDKYADELKKCYEEIYKNI